MKIGIKYAQKKNIILKYYLTKNEGYIYSLKYHYYKSLLNYINLKKHYFQFLFKISSNV